MRDKYQQHIASNMSQQSGNTGGAQGDSAQMPDRDPETGEKILYVCHGRMCGRHAKYIMDRLEQVRKRGVKIVPKQCTCMGMCSQSANIKCMKKVYSRMNPVKAAELAKKLAS